MWAVKPVKTIDSIERDLTVTWFTKQFVLNLGGLRFWVEDCYSLGVSCNNAMCVRDSLWGIALCTIRYISSQLSVSSWIFSQQSPHLSTAVAQREKKSKQFVFNKYFSLVLGVLKSKISKKSFELLLRKLDFKLFHYKARVQPVSKITTIATRNRCWM